MKLKNIDGREIYKNCQKYLIKWDGKSRSKYQFQVKQFLKQYWQKYNIYEEFPVFGSRMTLDFFNEHKRLGIEVQGEFHTQYSSFAHGNILGYRSQMKRDQKKEAWCILNGIKLLEIFPEDLPLTVSFFNKLEIDL